MVFETKPVRITELAKETEQYLLQKGCKKSTLGVYKATWHKFMAFSSSDVYSRTAAEDFLKLYFGVDVHSAIQKLDSRMRHALRHMNALEDYLNTGAVPRKRMRGHYSTVPGLYAFTASWSEYDIYSRFSWSCGDYYNGGVCKN